MNFSSVFFPCADINLEGMWHSPEGEGPFPAVVVCHPHPLYGGSMLNNVVAAVCHELPKHSIACLRFNFRGVGKSGGRFGNGIAEREDVRAALIYVLSMPEVDSRRVGLAGYSFGAGVALQVALEDERVSDLALISPTIPDGRLEQLETYKKPKLIIVGDADLIIRPERFERYIGKADPASEVHIIQGANHFWSGYEPEVAGKIARFFARGFKKGCT